VMRAQFRVTPIAADSTPIAADNAGRIKARVMVFAEEPEDHFSSTPRSLKHRRQSAWNPRQSALPMPCRRVTPRSHSQRKPT